MAPVDPAVEYVNVAVPMQGTELPVTAVGVAGAEVMGVSVIVVIGPAPQLFMAATVMVPEPEPEVTVMSVVP